MAVICGFIDPLLIFIYLIQQRRDALWDFSNQLHSEQFFFFY